MKISLKTKLFGVNNMKNNSSKIMSYELSKYHVF